MPAPTTDIRNHPGAGGCKPGERYEPLPIEWESDCEVAGRGGGSSSGVLSDDGICAENSCA